MAIVTDIGALGITKQREAVLRAIRDSGHHLTANEVFECAKLTAPGISFATVYNSLRYLRNEGLIGEVRFGGEAARYDRNLARHDHAVCTTCGILVDMDLPSSEALLKKAVELSKFDGDSVEIILRGTCPDCKKKSQEDVR